MHHGLADCGCAEDTCCTMPPEFVRVRYFYGQRLGVMELNDEQRYHQGKHAFHNARLHGAGVLCGLRAERFVLVQGSATTVLRVVRGAAIDACGREIIVGVDQCIDVAAWFARNRNRPELASFTSGTTQPLHVCLRYRECPSDPHGAARPVWMRHGQLRIGRLRERVRAVVADGRQDGDCGMSPSRRRPRSRTPSAPPWTPATLERRITLVGAVVRRRLKVLPAWPRSTSSQRRHHSGAARHSRRNARFPSGGPVVTAPRSMAFALAVGSRGGAHQRPGSGP